MTKEWFEVASVVLAVAMCSMLVVPI